MKLRDKETERHEARTLPCLKVVVQPVPGSRPGGHRQVHCPSTRVTKPSFSHCSVKSLQYKPAHKYAYTYTDLVF